MWKIVLVLLLTALAILAARLAYGSPAIESRIDALISDMRGGASAPLTPPLMYAGIRS